MSDSRRVTDKARGLSPLVLVAALLLLFMPDASGGTVGTLNTFTNGTVADADEVNANFQAVSTAIDDNDARLTLLEGAPPPPPPQILASQGLAPGPSGEVFGVYSQSGSENFAQLLIPRDGQLSNFSCRATASMAVGSSVTVTLRLNGAEVPSSALVFVRADGSTMKTSLVTPVAVSAGDLMTFRFQETLGVFPGGGVAYHAAVTLR